MGLQVYNFKSQCLMYIEQVKYLSNDCDLHKTEMWNTTCFFCSALLMPCFLPHLGSCNDLISKNLNHLSLPLHHPSHDHLIHVDWFWVSFLLLSLSHTELVDILLPTQTSEATGVLPLSFLPSQVNDNNCEKRISRDHRIHLPFLPG